MTYKSMIACSHFMVTPLQLVIWALRCGYVKIKFHALIALSTASCNSHHALPLKGLHQPQSFCRISTRHATYDTLVWLAHSIHKLSARFEVILLPQFAFWDKLSKAIDTGYTTDCRNRIKYIWSMTSLPRTRLCYGYTGSLHYLYSIKWTAANL